MGSKPLVDKSIVTRVDDAQARCQKMRPEGSESTAFTWIEIGQQADLFGCIVADGPPWRPADVANSIESRFRNALRCDRNADTRGCRRVLVAFRHAGE